MANQATYGDKLRVTKQADGSVRFEVVTISLLGIVTVSSSATLTAGQANEAALQTLSWTAAPVPAQTVKPMVDPVIPS